MIYLITDQPGHGKSLRALSMGLEYLKEGREVYLVRNPGVDYEKPGFKHLDSLAERLGCYRRSSLARFACARGR